MLVVYAASLNRWVSPDSLYQISNLSGANWLVELAKPVSYLVTLPIRWLPAAMIPFAANLFSALCAAISLVWLARSVTLLPHDRTKEERQRNSGKQGYLNLKSAWLPPSLAVLACGLQLTFWEHSVSATGEMFDLLLFAYMVRCLLEYRVKEDCAWLLRLAGVNGLAVANNWAMVIYLPLFVIAVLWIQGFFKFFQPKYFSDFLKRDEKLNLRLPFQMAGCWVAGASLFVLMPFLASRYHISHVDFRPGIKFALHVYRLYLSGYSLPVILGLALMAIVPLCFMGIRWGKLLSEVHPYALWFTTLMFHVVHAFFLFGTLWMMLDSPFSPRSILSFYPCLPVYYLMALSIGYFSGYFLLVFKPRVERAKHFFQHPLLPILNVLALAGLSLLLLLVPVIFFYKNLPEIRRQKSGTLAGYLDGLQEALPVSGSVVLSEDSIRLQYLNAALTRQGHQADYLLVDTGLLTRQSTYFEFLDRRYPKFKLGALLGKSSPAITNTPGLLQFLGGLARSHELYFMHPFAGYLGEFFYQQPRKMFYQLKPYPTNSRFIPPLTPELNRENEAFWRTFSSRRLPVLTQRLDAPKAPRANNLIERFFKKTYIEPPSDGEAMLAGGYYSMLLDGWGVEQQRSGRLAEAASSFETARRLNPENNSAQINLEANRQLQNRVPLMIDPSLGTEERFNQRRDWDQSLRQDGPADEPNVCYRFGALLAEIKMYRQSLQQFTRAQILAPSDINIPLRIAECYLNLTDPTNALAEAEQVLRIVPENPRALFLKSFALVRLEKFSRAVSAVNDYLRFDANNADARLLRGFSEFKLGSPAAARADYESAAKLAANPYGAYYALAELGYYSHDAALTQTNCELYLACAPADAVEKPSIIQWLAEAKAARAKLPVNGAPAAKIK